MNAKISNFLLAGKRLHSSEIVHLLISSSFGLNAIFYAAWLGYSIGIWALLIQCAWSISFFLLIPAANHFGTIVSLHDFLGQQFGQRTKLLAALCSLIGISYFVVWEVNINVATITPLVPGQGTSSAFLVSLFALVAVVYTLLFGLRGNAFIDKYINLIKILILIALCMSASYTFLQLPGYLIYKSIFPSLDTVIAKIGIFGLITNIVFNLAWQFVDNSSWQSIIGGAHVSTDSTSINLKYSGLLIFLTVNIFSTVLGISLAHISTITTDNILIMTSKALPQYTSFISIGIIILSITSMMSLLDGMLLTSALTVNIDIMPAKFMSTVSVKKRLRMIQLSIIALGIVMIWGIGSIMKAFQINLFDFLYIIVISQLALIGPVVLGLYVKGKKSKSMWIAIVVALIVGFGAVAISGATKSQQLLDGAGTFTVIASLIVALIVNRWR